MACDRRGLSHTGTSFDLRGAHDVQVRVTWRRSGSPTRVRGRTVSTVYLHNIVGWGTNGLAIASRALGLLAAATIALRLLPHCPRAARTPFRTRWGPKVIFVVSLHTDMSRLSRLRLFSTGGRGVVSVSMGALTRTAAESRVSVLPVLTPPSRGWRSLWGGPICGGARESVVFPGDCPSLSVFESVSTVDLRTLSPNLVVPGSVSEFNTGKLHYLYVLLDIFENSFKFSYKQ